MTITREQVADLREGDIVELTSTTWLGGAVRGPLRYNGEYEALVLNSPCFGETYVIRNAQGDPSCADERSLTVVSRAPRPLYVNHPRTEPVAGDVVRDADRADSVVSWSRAVGSLGNHGWRYTGSANHWHSSMPARLRLLVDGETGRCVP